MLRVTTDDVAKKAGVSQSTVSRVLNDYPYIKKETREKVLAVINEMGFTRDEIARSLVEKRTNSIGLILGSISNPFFAESAEIIIERAQELGYDVLIYNTGHSDENLEKAINMLIGKRVEGIILTGVRRDFKEVIKKPKKNGIQTILYNSCLDADVGDYIVLDNKKGAKMAVNYLMELGHKQIAYISGPSKYLETHQRNLGYQEALNENGLKYDADLIYSSDFCYSEIYEFSKALLLKRQPPTAFFAASDQMALAVLDAAASLGLSVPNDVSVIGFDNIRLSSNEYIGLTTISQEMDSMALIAIDKLIHKIENDCDSEIQVMLEPQLIVRKTTGEVKRK